MSEKVEKARELFLEGYNCAQAVVGAFSDDVGLDFDTAMRLASSFGAGMGRLREVCGAVSGSFMILGLKFGYNSPDDKDGKIRHYKLIQDVAERVCDEKGSIICREILGKRADKKESYVPDDRTADYYKTRPCLGMVEEMAKITEEILKNEI